MKLIRSLLLVVALDLICGLAVAVIGRRFVPGFDIRGPFLVLSPIFAITVFMGGVFQFLFHLGGENNAKQADVEFIEGIAAEFGFEPVRIYQKKFGDNVVPCIELKNNSLRCLAHTWPKMDRHTRRFAVVYALMGAKTSWVKWSFRRYGPLSLAAFAAGLNLWTILVSHSLIAALLVMESTLNQTKKTTKRDLGALELTRDLKGAVAYVRAVDRLDGSAEKRIADLRVAASNLGIA